MKEGSGAMSPEFQGKWFQPRILYSAKLSSVRIKTFADVCVLKDCA